MPVKFSIRHILILIITYFPLFLKSQDDSLASKLKQEGRAQLEAGQTTEAFKSMTGALKIYEDKKDKLNSATIYNDLGILYLTTGNFPKALEMDLKALSIHEKYGTRESIIPTYNNLGNLYAELKEYNEALKYYKLALSLSEKIKNKKRMASLRINIGGIYYHLDSTKKTIENYLLALQLFREIGNKKRIATCLHNIGLFYDTNDDYEKAEKYYLESIEISLSENLREELSYAYSNLAVLNIKRKRYNSVKDYVNKSMKIAMERNDIAEIKQNYLTLAYLDSSTSNYKDYINDYKMAIKYGNILRNEEGDKKMIQDQMRYDFSKKQDSLKAVQDKKAAILIEENRIKDLQIKQNRYFIIGILALTLLISVIAFLFIRQNRLRNEQQKIQLEQKLLRSQMNPHFIFNSLNSIHSVVLNGDIKNAATYLASFAKLIRAILESSRFEFIPLEKEISLLENYISLQQLRFENGIKYTIEVDPELNLHETLLPPMLTQPFIENAFEYGLYDAKEDARLDITFKKDNDFLQIEVVDNGHGLNETKNNKHHISLASAITKERLTLLNNKAKKKTNFSISEAFPANNERKGVKVSFSIPLNG